MLQSLNPEPDSRGAKLIATLDDMTSLIRMEMKPFIYAVERDIVQESDVVWFFGHAIHELPDDEARELMATIYRGYI